VDRAATARVGLTPGDVIQAVRIGLVGEAQSDVWVGQRSFELLLRLKDHRRADANAIRRLIDDGHAGSGFPLGQLAAIE
jgi:cobalt-zinc-cadmium resistance protein CzcA